MREIYAICNQKGGVAKSTTAGALASGLTQRGYKTLVIDLDPQGNLTYSYSNEISNVQNSYQLLINTTVDPRELVDHTAQGDIIKSVPDLSRIEGLFNNEIGREHHLEKALEPLHKEYDYIILDCPPALSMLSVNALTACTKVIIPVQADFYSLQAVGQLMYTVDAVKQYHNKDIEIEGLLLTRYNKRATVSKEVADMLKDTANHYGTKLFNTTIRECTALKEAQAFKKSIYTYAPKSNATADYTALLDELIK